MTKKTPPTPIRKNNDPVEISITETGFGWFEKLIFGTNYEIKVSKGMIGLRGPFYARTLKGAKNLGYKLAKEEFKPREPKKEVFRDTIKF